MSYLGELSCCGNRGVLESCGVDPRKFAGVMAGLGKGEGGWRGRGMGMSAPSRAVFGVDDAGALEEVRGGLAGIGGGYPGWARESHSKTIDGDNATFGMRQRYDEATYGPLGGGYPGFFSPNRALQGATNRNFGGRAPNARLGLGSGYPGWSRERRPFQQLQGLGSGYPGWSRERRPFQQLQGFFSDLWKKVRPDEPGADASLMEQAGETGLDVLDRVADLVDAHGSDALSTAISGDVAGGVRTLLTGRAKAAPDPTPAAQPTRPPSPETSSLGKGLAVLAVLAGAYAVSRKR